MKLLLLVTLLTGGATTLNVSPRIGWQIGNVFQCSIPGICYFSDYNFYGCYCDRLIHNREEDLDRCCQVRDNCYAQFKKLESCKYLKEKIYRFYYSYLCSGNKFTCSEENNACEAFVCNCDQQVAICFSKLNKDIRC